MRSPKWEAWESEVKCLGSVMLDNGALDRLGDLVGVDDLADPRHRLVWAAMGRLRAKGHPIDPETVLALLDEAGEVAAAGGIDYVCGLREVTFTSVNVEHHGHILARYSAKRRLRAKLQQSLDDLGDTPAEEVPEFRDAIVGGLLDEQQDAPAVAVDLIDALKEELADIRHRNANPQPFVGIPSGLIDLDAITNGFEDTDFVTLGACSGHGKTMAGMHLAVHGARLSGRHSLYISVEVKATRLARRTLASLAQLDATKLKTARLDDADFEAMQRGVEQFLPLRGLVSLVHAPKGTVGTVHREVRRYRMRPNVPRLGLVVVDYIQRLHPVERRRSREEEVAEMARTLKDLANQNDCPVVVLAQLNREISKRASKRPIASDLRESSALEHESSVLLFLHRQELWGEESMKGKAEFIVAKARDGEAGIATVGCNAAQQRFYNLDRWHG